MNELTGQGAHSQTLALPEVEQVYPVFKKGGLAAPELYAFLKSELPEWIDLLDEKIAQKAGASLAIAYNAGMLWPRQDQ